MELHNTIEFDRTRIGRIEMYQNLQTNKGRVAFIFMVKDYMAYLRSRPHERLGYDEEVEKLAAIDFVKAINSRETGWPLARQVVPEFQRPQATFDHLHQPLRFVLQAVQPNIVRPLPQIPDAQRVEEDHIWRKYSDTIQYIAYLAGEPLLITPERRAEQATLLHNLSMALKVTDDGERNLEVEGSDREITDAENSET